MKKIDIHLLKMTAAFFAVMLFAVSCTKDKVPEPPVTPKSKKDLISRQWIQTDLIATLGGFTQSVFDDEIKDCAQDNIFFFKSDGTFTITENALKCTAGGPDLVASGTWELIDDDKKIIIDPANEDPQTLTITELTETSFKGSLVDNSTGIEVTLLGVYKAK